MGMPWQSCSSALRQSDFVPTDVVHVPKLPGEEDSTDDTLGFCPVSVLRSCLISSCRVSLGPSVAYESFENGFPDEPKPLLGIETKCLC